MKKSALKNAVLIGGASFVSLPAMAQTQNAAAVADNLTGQLSSFMNLALQVGFLMGVVLFVSGLYMLYKDSQQPGQGNAKKGFIGLAVGSALLIAPTLMDVGTSSLVEGETAPGGMFEAPR